MLLPVLLVGSALAISTVSGLVGGTAEAATTDRYDAVAWRARQSDYLKQVSTRPLEPGNTHSIMAHAEWARRDPTFKWNSTAPSPSDYAGSFANLAAMKDTGDFDINRYLFLLQGWGADIPPSLVDAFTQQILSFKYWWTEPTPAGKIDSKYYWTENHQIVFLADEFIAGQAFPTSTFTNSGMTGVDHMNHARPLIMKWLASRARFGFSEWLSNVYFEKDMVGLLLLADWSNDAEITQWSSAVLDMMLIELAQNTHAGAFASTHGRSYTKERTNGLSELTFTTAKLIFDDTPYPYGGFDNVIYLATAHRYRPPAVALTIAKDRSVGVVRQHQGLPLDATAMQTPNPVAPYGTSYDDPMVWWGMGAQFPWQIVPLSVYMINKYDLWKTSNFQQALGIKPFVDSSTIPQLQNIAHLIARQVNPGLLSEVDTYTWRSPEVSLSTAQDWRPGQRSEQALISEASLDPRAQVFVQHPTTTATNTNPESGYWTGEGATPRAAQNQNVSISIYAPQYVSATSGPLAQLSYLPMTHAYFPTERFDEVVEKNGWVIGRKGSGYVALWSWRPTTWAAPAKSAGIDASLTQRYDLQALGGPDNAWVTEVGRAADWAGNTDPFGAFVAAITTAPITAVPIGGAAHQAADGFDVQYQSPTQGAMALGWNSPFTVKGSTVALHGYPRWSTPWSQVPTGALRYQVAAGGASLGLNFTALVAGTPSGAPAATNDAYAVAADVALVTAAPGVLANDTGISITVKDHTDPVHGSLTQNANGSFTYTPTPGFSGADSYTYTLADSFGRTSTASVTLTVGGPEVAGGVGGTVTDAGTGLPLSGIVVTLMRPNPSWVMVGSATTDATGKYRFGSLATGSYALRFWDPLGQHEMVWDDRQQTYKTADPVSVSATTQAVTVDQALPNAPPGVIVGRTQTSTWEGIDGIQVLLFTKAKGLYKTTTTGALGYYRFGQLPAGDYSIAFVDPSNTYPVQWYRFKRLQANADTVTVGSDLVRADAMLG